VNAVVKGKKFFYGWIVLGASFVVMAAVMGGVYYAFGVFFRPMIAELGWSRGAGSIGFALMTVMQALAGPLIGTSIVRFGVRKVMVFGSLMVIFALLLLSRTTQLWHLYFFYGVMCGIGMPSIFMPVMAMVNNWFIRRRSLAFGITMSGSGVGTVILAPAVRYLIEIIEWRASWLALGGMVFVFTLLPALILARTKPEDMGQLSDGVMLQAEEKNSAPVVKRVYTTPVDWETKAALKTPALWLIALFMCANMFALNVMATHQVAHLEDIGMSPIIAAGVLGLLVGISCLGRLLGGILGDRIEPRYIAACACALQAIGLVIFINARVLTLLYAYVVAYGVAYGALIVLPPVLLGAYYGRRNFSAIQGISYAPFTIIAGAGPIFAGFVFDVVGSYVIPLSVAAAFCAVGVVCALLAKPPHSHVH
jgi:OFA family oxalate/formate antiporter-like MFS transporter